MNPQQLNQKYPHLEEEQHTIEAEILTKGNHNGDTLVYIADGEEIESFGEFYVDRSNMLHHTHIFPDGKEYEIIIPYVNGDVSKQEIKALD